MALSAAMLALLIASTTIRAGAQTQVTVPGNASGIFGNHHNRNAPGIFGNHYDLRVPFVPAITVDGPATIKIAYVSGTVTGIGGVDTGPNGVSWNTHGNQSPLQEKDGIAGGRIPNLDALIGAFVCKRRSDSPKFSAIDGTKGVVRVGIVPEALFFVGEGITYEAKEAGTLYLGINDWITSNNGGAFVVDVSVVPYPYDAAAQFSGTDNPNGVWSYGCMESLGAAFQLYTQQIGSISGVYDWTTAPCVPPDDPHMVPALIYNSTNASVTPVPPSSVTFPAHAVAFHPGPQGQNSVLRFTAPASGNYQVQAVFWGDDFVGPTTTDVHVLHNGLGLYTSDVYGFGPSSDQSFTTTVSLAAGDTIDFTVGDGTDGNFYNDSTGVSAVITPQD
jgi:hypothetical protein